MIKPDITLRASTSPYGAISTFVYYQTKESGGYVLPIKEGEDSDTLSFRIYNNYALNSNISEASNIYVTTFDGSSPHSASTLIVSQAWVHVYETGFGQAATGSGLYSQFTGLDTAVGGTNIYYFELGSDGNTPAVLYAGSGNNGVGFIEVNTYMSVPSDSSFGSYQFCISVDYNWST